MIVLIKDSLFLNNRLLLDFLAETMDIANYFQNRLPIKS